MIILNEEEAHKTHALLVDIYRNISEARYTHIRAKYTSGWDGDITRYNKVGYCIENAYEYAKDLPELDSDKDNLRLYAFHGLKAAKSLHFILWKSCCYPLVRWPSPNAHGWPDSCFRDPKLAPGVWRITLDLLDEVVALVNAYEREVFR